MARAGGSSSAIAPIVRRGGLSDRAALAVLVGCYLSTAFWLRIPPRFPIGDSWSFAWSARELVEHGRIALNDAQAMSLVAQLLLAAPVAAVFGATPGVLNAFTFALSGVTVLLLHAALRSSGLGPKQALLGAATLAANPIWMAQSISFETEVPFVFFSLAGVASLLRWDRGAGGRFSWWGAWSCLAAATLVRQHGVVFSLAGVVYLVSRRTAQRAPIVPMLLPVLACTAFLTWLRLGPGVPKAYDWHLGAFLTQLADPPRFALTRSLGVIALLHYTGLFLLPLLPITWVHGGAAPARRLTVTLLIVGAFSAGTLLLLATGRAMPYLPNVLTLAGVLGPLGISSPSAGVPFALTLVSWLGACGTLAPAFARWHGAAEGSAGASAPTRAAQDFLLASGLLLLAFSLATGLHFDRYLLVPLPFLLPAVLRGSAASRPRVLASALLVVFSLAFSLFFVDQRIRFAGCEWDAAAALMARGIDPWRIDGGYAFNGYYSYPELSARFGKTQPNPWAAWLHPSAEYVVRTFPLTDARVSLLEHRVCANRRFLTPADVFVYRRTVFDGSPLPTLFDTAQ